MNIVFVSRSRTIKIPKKFLEKWIADVLRALVKHKILSAAQKRLLRNDLELVLAFVTTSQMKKLNAQFRGKDYATDVLSFAGEGLGELVLCMPVIERQARDHDLTLNEELGYMVLHGILHLLGFDHEGTKAEEARMFKVQDEIFAKLR